jgi:hypothetical protein
LIFAIIEVINFLSFYFMNNDEIKQILLENKASMERMEEKVNKMHKKMLWGTIGSILRIILIVGPLIVGIVYLSPFVKQYMGGIQSAFEILNPTGSINTIQQTGENTSGIDLETICNPNTRQIIEDMCK